MNSYYGPYRKGIWFDCENKNYLKKTIDFMSQPKNANLATFVGAVIGTLAAIVGAVFMVV